MCEPKTKTRADIPKMTLWYVPKLRPIRPAWLIKEMGLDDKVEYQYLPMTLGPPGPEREAFRQRVHPHSTVPALEVAGRPAMLESSAMCLYIADLPAGAACMAPPLGDRSEYYDWVLYAGARLDEAMEALFWQWWATKPADRDPAVIAKWQKVAELCFDKAEKTLGKQPFLLGQEMSAADCVMGFNMLWAEERGMNKGFLLQGRPHCQAYLARIKARPALQAALALPGEEVVVPVHDD